jgi:hypothetical protein
MSGGLSRGCVDGEWVVDRSAGKSTPRRPGRRILVPACFIKADASPLSGLVLIPHLTPRPRAEQLLAEHDYRQPECGGQRQHRGHAIFAARSVPRGITVLWIPCAVPRLASVFHLPRKFKTLAMEANLIDHSRTGWCSIRAFTLVLLFTRLLITFQQAAFVRRFPVGERRRSTEIRKNLG